MRFNWQRVLDKILASMKFHNQSFSYFLKVLVNIIICTILNTLNTYKAIWIHPNNAACSEQQFIILVKSRAGFHNWGPPTLLNSQSNFTLYLNQKASQSNIIKRQTRHKMNKIYTIIYVTHPPSIYFINLLTIFLATSVFVSEDARDSHSRRGHLYLSLNAASVNNSVSTFSQCTIPFNVNYMSIHQFFLSFMPCIHTHPVSITVLPFEIKFTYVHQEEKYTCIHDLFSYTVNAVNLRETTSVCQSWPP